MVYQGTPSCLEASPTVHNPSLTLETAASSCSYLHICLLHLGTRALYHIITKLPDSGDLCGNITEFGVAEGDPPPPQMK